MQTFLSLRSKFLLQLFFWGLLFFALSRLGFVLYHRWAWQGVVSTDLFRSFWYGMYMDASTLGYLLVPVWLLLVCGLLINPLRRIGIFKVYLWFVFLFVSVVVLVDLPMYGAWGHRADDAPLRYLESPREAWASVSHLPVFAMALALIFWLGLGFWCIHRWLRVRKLWISTPAGRSDLALLPLAGLLVLAIRGGWQELPFNQSAVYFSDHRFPNHAALNPVWTFIHAVTHRRATSNPHVFVKREKAEAAVQSLFSQSAGISHPDTALGLPPKPNILLIIWESFTAKALHRKIDGVEITPRFTQLTNEGIYFSNFYASGDRTDKGLAAILSGYPALNAWSILRNTSKAQNLPTLAKHFGLLGYATPFFYGGDLQFANIQAYLQSGGFRPLLQQDDFPNLAKNSKWGIHDGPMSDALLSALDKQPTPFFATWLTLSSHEPYEVAVEKAFASPDETAQFLHTHHYTDAVIGRFIDRCKTKPWWKNTLVVIVGDHGHVLPRSTSRLEDFHTPMLWLGGVVRKPVRIDYPTSQLDIAATLQGFAGIQNQTFPFSKTLFDRTHPWAAFTFDNGVGFVSPSGHSVWDNNGRQLAETSGRGGAPQSDTGRMLQQLLWDDFLKR